MNKESTAADVKLPLYNKSDKKFKNKIKTLEKDRRRYVLK